MKKHYNLLEKWKLNDFENPQIQSINRLKSRSTLIQFSSRKNAINYDYKNKENYQKLNGMWKFKLFDSPFKITKKDMKFNNFDNFNDIEVPLPWQMAGYDKMHYSDIWWTFPITPPKVGTNNPTGIYKKKIKINKIKNNKNYILRFNASDSCIKLFINGQEVGLTKGSRYISEFLINEFIKEGNNYLTIVCYKWSDGSYLEDQDQWWFSGLYRDVELIVEEKNFIQDIFIQTKRIKNKKYLLNINLHIKQKTEINIELLDKNNNNIFNQKIIGEGIVNITKQINNIKEWTAENPILYKLIISNGTWWTTQRIGFREIKTQGRKILVNQKQIMLKGVNLHSHNSYTGKYVPLEKLISELKLMKKHNINAIRTSHYPQQQGFYEVCDELGFYVMDEADLEAHGFELTGDWSWTSNDLKFQKSYIERGIRMVYQNKNHPSIIMWSLGNETGWGNNFITMIKAMKEIDNTRLFHYEGDFECEFVDVHSNMYTRIEKNSEELGKRNLKDVIIGSVGKEKHPNWLNKPHIECEFAHAMGNGPGGLKEYFDAFYSNKAFNGGFVWEWYDHGIYTKDKNGEYFKYGGDFNDEPTNGPFCIDGLLMPNGIPSPGLIEYKEVIAPINTKLINNNIIEIENRFDFINFEKYLFELSIIDSNNKILITKELPIQELCARQKTNIKIPNFIKENNKFYFLQIKMFLNVNTKYAKKGFLVSTKQHELKNHLYKNKINYSKNDLQIENKELFYLISNSNISLKIDKSNGNLLNIKKNNKLVFLEGPKLNFWRGLTDNDADQYKEIWMKKFFVHLFSETLLELKVTKKEKYVEISKQVINGAVNQAWYFISKYNFKIYGDGEIKIHVSGKPSGITSLKKEDIKSVGSGSSIKIDPNDIIPKMLPRIGLKWKLKKDYSNFEYFGKGPGETYSDSQTANPYGLWKQNIDQSFTNYVHPQETGNKHKTLWVKFKSKDNYFKIESNGIKNRFDFSALWYDDMDLTIAKHPFELKKKDYITLNIDYKQNGLGSNSCGPLPSLKHRCQFENFEIIFNIK